MDWTITQEHHVSPATFYGGKRVPEVEFFYAIRRDDGSLVFRAHTIAFAQDLVDRLVHSHSRAATA